MNSFCLICASWYFGQHIIMCSKCRARIFRWVSDYDMKFLRQGSVLGKL